MSEDPLVRSAPHLMSRLLALFAAATLLLAVVVAPASGATWPHEDVVVAGVDAVSVWADSPEADLDVVEEHAVDDEDTQLGEGDDDETKHASTSRSFPDRRLKRVRARGPPRQASWARFLLTQAPRGPPIA